jgi:hypothetical protein
MSPIDLRAVARGALAGLLLIVPLSALRAILDRDVHDFDSSGWVPLFALALFAAYVVAGAVAGRRTEDAPMSNGLLAGIGAVLLWLPLRVLIWIVRSESDGLFSGSDPVFTFGQIFGSMLFAAVFGLIGGILGARSVRARRVSPDGTP